MYSTSKRFPEASMTTAFEAPSKEDQSLSAVPLASTNTPWLEASSWPSALKVVSVKTALAAFFTGPGCAMVAAAVKSSPAAMIVRMLKVIFLN